MSQFLGKVEDDHGNSLYLHRLGTDISLSCYGPAGGRTSWVDVPASLLPKLIDELEAQLVRSTEFLLKRVREDMDAIERDLAEQQRAMELLKSELSWERNPESMGR